MVTLEGDGFTLRQMTLSDADVRGYLACHADEDARLCFMSVPADTDAARAELEAVVPDERFWAIDVAGSFAGFVRLEVGDAPYADFKASISYGVARAYRGRGLATGAVTLVSNYALTTLGLVRVEAVCRSFNTASARVLEKSGFAHEGTLRKNKRRETENGVEYLDDMVWSRVR